ncbi:MAG: C-GCAxxG-C-C family protein [Spirochaetales bacterium]|nr:C-GCAxxG-C-C family protein [Spirochaetales bacterium]
MSEKQKEARQIFDNGFNCAQATLAPFAEELKLSREDALKMTSGFGAGMRKGEVCGAVTGAVMALGLKRGHTIANDPESKERAYELTKEFTAQFENRFGKIRCKELLGYDITVEEEVDRIKELDLFNTKCPLFVEGAVTIVEEIIKNS